MNFLFFFSIGFHLSLPTGLSIIFLVMWGALLWKLFSTSSHVLLLLLTLEVFMLITMLILTHNKTNSSSNSEMIMVFFTLAVCEASLGLGLLIQLARKTGSEMLYFL